jgi:hypothetical protein
MKVEPSWMRLVPLYNRPKGTPPPLPLCATQEKCTIYKPNSRPFPDTKTARASILYFSASKMMGSTFLWFIRNSAYDILL